MTAEAWPFVLAGIPIVLLVAGLVLRKPLWGILAVVLFLPFNALLVSVSPDSLGGLLGAFKDAVLILLVVRALLSGKFRQVPGWHFFIVLLCVALALAASLQTPDTIQALYGFRNNYLPILFLLVVPACFTYEQGETIKKTVGWVAQVAAVIAIVTWQMGLDWLYSLGILPVAPGQGFPVSYFLSGSVDPRAFSPYVAPNEAAAALVLAIAAIATIQQWTAKRRALMMVLPVAAVLVTQSRSGLIGLALLLGFLVGRWAYVNSPKLFPIVVLYSFLGFFGGLYSFLDRRLSGEVIDTSIGGHAESWIETFVLLKERPVGYGLGRVGPRAAEFESEPIFTEGFWFVIGMESGVLAMCAFAALIVGCMLYGAREWRGPGFLAALVGAGTLVSQLVLPTFQDGSVSHLHWLLLGVAYIGWTPRPRLTRGPASARSGVGHRDKAMRA